jgi:TolB protein
LDAVSSDLVTDGATIAFKGSGILWKAPVSTYWNQVPVAIQIAKTPSWSPIDDRIVFETTSSLAIVAATGGSVTNLPPSGAHNPAWSPDASKIAYDANGRIWILELASFVSTPITSGATTDEHPTWSPDGGWIAFSSRRSGSRALWVAARRRGMARRFN